MEDRNPPRCDRAYTRKGNDFARRGAALLHPKMRAAERPEFSLISVVSAHTPRIVAKLAYVAGSGMATSMGET